MAVNTSTGFASAILGPSSFDQIFLNGMIEVRTGLQPASANLAPTGTLLGKITRDGGIWAAGNPTNGLQFERAGRYALKALSHIWLLDGSGTGVAGWFRLLANAADAGGVSETLPRIDGAIALIPDGEGESPEAQLFLPTLDITPSTSIGVGQWYYALPPI